MITAGIAQVVEAVHLGGLEIPIAFNTILIGPASALYKNCQTAETATIDAKYGK